jgi:hypothetical protein
MIIWVFNTPSLDEEVDFIYASLKKGISRYGWSHIDNADLIKLNEKSWEDLTKKERECCVFYLLEIKKGDWIVHINVPEWGKCTAGKVIETYKWDEKPNKLGGDYSENGNFRHTFKLDINSIIEFDRNDPNITPYISRRLKLQGRYWRIYEPEQFIRSIKNLKKNVVKIKSNVENGLYYLKEDIKPSLGSIADSIQKNHPGKKLEGLLGIVFKNVPNVVSVNINGSGFGTDNGADLIITYSTGLPINGLQKEEILVVQVKSFTDVHYELNAVEQIKTAINKYKANVGLIISTAIASEELKKKVEETQEKLGIPIGLMCHEEVAAFIIKYGSEYLF